METKKKKTFAAGAREEESERDKRDWTKKPLM